MRNKWWLPKGRMLIFGLGDAGLPEVHTVGVRNLTSAAPVMPEHDHPGTIEIKHVISGERLYAMNGHEYRLRGNDVLVTFPDERHSSGDRPVRIGVQYWMGVKLPRRPQAFLGLQARDAWPLITALRTLPVRQFKAHPKMRAAFEDILEQHRNAPKPLRKTWLALAVLNWLRLVIAASQREAARRQGAKPDNVSPEIHAVIEAIERSPEEPYDIALLADLAGLSVSRFKARFCEELGVPPMQFVLRKKLERAESLLNAGKSVTAVAHALHFSSSQYFATVFRRHLGMSPRDAMRA